MPKNTGCIKNPARFTFEAMVIAVDARFIANDVLDSYDEFRKELLTEWIKRHPMQQFYLISDRPVLNFYFPPNAQTLLLRPKATHPLLWKYWLEIRLPSLLKKIKADFFVGLNGQVSLRSKIPQCFLVHETGLNGPKVLPGSRPFFYKRYVPKFLRKAEASFVLSEAIKSNLLEKFALPESRIAVLPPAVKDIYVPFGWEEKKEIKDQYTAGKEYFLHPSRNLSVDQLVHVLKAFSFFKKRQQSKMKLVLAGTFSDQKKADELLRHFKYRADVVITGEKDEARLIAAAYAVVQIGEGFDTGFLKAMKSAVPVLLSDKAVMKEWAGEAALYFDGNNITEVAEMMMFIYKDEGTRSQMIQKGMEISRNYTWQRTIDVFERALTGLGT